MKVEITDVSTYHPPFPTLSEWLEWILADMPDGASGRIRIRDGGASYHDTPYPWRPREHIHASARYSGRALAYKSGHLTDKILSGHVVKAVCHGRDFDVQVLLVKPMPRRRPGSDPVVPIPSGPCIPRSYFTDCNDDNDLPF